MRIYLVVMDETEEAKIALRFASLRAARTGGAQHINVLRKPPDNGVTIRRAGTLTSAR